jgi:hypothetical protein
MMEGFPSLFRDLRNPKVSIRGGDRQGGGGEYGIIGKAACRSVMFLLTASLF